VQESQNKRDRAHDNTSKGERERQSARESARVLVPVCVLLCFIVAVFLTLCVCARLSVNIQENNCFMCVCSCGIENEYQTIGVCFSGSYSDALSKYKHQL